MKNRKVLPREVLLHSASLRMTSQFLFLLLPLFFVQQGSEEAEDYKISMQSP